MSQGILGLFFPSGIVGRLDNQIHIFAEENIEQPCPHLGQDLPAFSLCIPIMTYGELIGLFHISGQTQNQNLDKLEQKKELARNLAEHIGLSLANLKLREQLRAESIRDPLTNLSTGGTWKNR